MTKREKLCLEKRNIDGQENETFCKHYVKKFGGYLFHLFFGFQNFMLFLSGVVMTFFCYIFFNGRQHVEIMSKCIGYGLIIIFYFFWIYFIVRGLWYWKYTKHIFVTNEGIWVMSFSINGWNPNFMGERVFWSASWSLYTWTELKKVSDSNEGNPKRDAFEKIDDFVIRLTGLKTIYLTRWDGIGRIDFLSKKDAQDILDCTKEQKKPKRKKKKQNDKISD